MIQTIFLHNVNHLYIVISVNAANCLSPYFPTNFQQHKKQFTPSQFFLTEKGEKKKERSKQTLETTKINRLRYLKKVCFLGRYLEKKKGWKSFSLERQTEYDGRKKRDSIFYTVFFIVAAITDTQINFTKKFANFAENYVFCSIETLTTQLHLTLY